MPSAVAVSSRPAPPRSSPPQGPRQAHPPPHIYAQLYLFIFHSFSTYLALVNLAKMPTLADLRGMSKQQLDKISKPDLVANIIAASDTDFGALTRIEARMNELQQTCIGIRQEAAAMNKINEDKMNAMQVKIDKQSEIIMKQQLYLEAADRKERETNLIILGVPEDGTPVDGANNDNEKLAKIWDKVNDQSDRVSSKRLGRTIQTGKTRPILVRVISREVRDTVLEKTKELKDAGEVYKKIYIKKDVHPAVRKEWNRLREAEKLEKEKPVNSGVEIRLDTRERKLYRDGVVIDSWTPHPF